MDAKLKQSALEAVRLLDLVAASATVQRAMHVKAQAAIELLVKVINEIEVEKDDEGEQS